MGLEATRTDGRAACVLAAGALLAALAAPAPALASDAPSGEPAAGPAPPPAALSVTFSPVHLAFRVLEVSAEVALGGHVGLALILGAGHQPPPSADCGSECLPGEAYEAGGQLRWYPWGRFQGFHLGAEVLALSLSSWDGQAVGTNFAGVSLGAFAGYKVVWRSGPTLEAQLGLQGLVSGAGSGSAACGGGCSGTGMEPPILLNLNAGWSF